MKGLVLVFKKIIAPLANRSVLVISFKPDQIKRKLIGVTTLPVYCQLSPAIINYWLWPGDDDGELMMMINFI